MSEEMSLEQQLLDKLIAERNDLDQHIALLQKRLGLASDAQTRNEGNLAAPFNPQELLSRSGVQRGEFFGMSRPQAAIALLKKAQQTLTTTQIFEALKDSGLDLSGKNALNGLYTSLSRLSEVKRVAPNTWGLREWYPHLKEPKKRTIIITNDESRSRALPLSEVDKK